jgi:hypothetical protein
VKKLETLMSAGGRLMLKPSSLARNLAGNFGGKKRRNANAAPKLFFKFTTRVSFSTSLFTQGDQIGRIFSHWAISFFSKFFLGGGCFLVLQNEPSFWTTFFHGKIYVLILIKTCWDPFWANFFHKLIWSPCFFTAHVNNLDVKTYALF